MLTTVSLLSNRLFRKDTGPQIFQESKSHLQILGARRVTGCKQTAVIMLKY
jgi:hypothetical protein